ncbi:two-component system, OmpR family, response regulator [Bathymodiolus platifrons methanotrophic gill symbiont]|nr:two-component system, OmpR family, response regulator [Bathymodiolus platifrons methanotrophic gill symbiont]
MRILLIEDDVELAKQVSKMLHNAQFVIDVAHDGIEGLYLGNTAFYDAVILDLGLPKLDGIDVLMQWRQAGRAMPVLILTARQTWREKVTGLQAGADDYLAKPFAMEELLARVEALIRRASGHPNPIFECGEYALIPILHK